MQPLISICMPNYNYEQFLNESIDSVLGQTYQNFELIIGDDCSKDGSLKVIQSYNDPRIKHFSNEKNLYQFKNINKMLEMANGELIAILHSDDKYAPTFLEEVVKAYNTYPDKRVFVSGVYFYHSDINKIEPWHPYIGGGVKDKKEVLIRLAKENNIGNSVNFVVHRECLEKVGLWATTVQCIGDYDYLMRLGNFYDFVYIPEILTYYRIHSSQNTTKYQWKPNRYNEGLEIFNKYLTNSSVLSEKAKKKLRYIGSRYRIHKAYQSGVQKNSGKVTRLILEFSIKNLPELWFEPTWYIAYLSSYFLEENIPQDFKRVAQMFAKLVLFPQKVAINRIIEKLIKEEVHA